jgi:hypothetical protein
MTPCLICTPARAHSPRIPHAPPRQDVIYLLRHARRRPLLAGVVVAVGRRRRRRARALGHAAPAPPPPLLAHARSARRSRLPLEAPATRRVHPRTPPWRTTSRAWWTVRSPGAPRTDANCRGSAHDVSSALGPAALCAPALADGGAGLALRCAGAPVAGEGAAAAGVGDEGRLTDLCAAAAAAVAPSTPRSPFRPPADMITVLTNDGRAIVVRGPRAAEVGGHRPPSGS